MQAWIKSRALLLSKRTLLLVAGQRGGLTQSRRSAKLAPLNSNARSAAERVNSTSVGPEASTAI